MKTWNIYIRAGARIRTSEKSSNSDLFFYNLLTAWCSADEFYPLPNFLPNAYIFENQLRAYLATVLRYLATSEKVTTGLDYSYYPWDAFNYSMCPDDSNRNTSLTAARANHTRNLDIETGIFIRRLRCFQRNHAENDFEERTRQDSQLRDLFFWGRSSKDSPDTYRDWLQWEKNKPTIYWPLRISSRESTTLDRTTTSHSQTYPPEHTGFYIQSCMRFSTCFNFYLSLFFWRVSFTPSVQIWFSMRIFPRSICVCSCP